MKLLTTIPCVATILLAMACQSTTIQNVVVPLPQQMSFTGGYFAADSTQFVGQIDNGIVAYKIDSTHQGLEPEGYQLKVSREGIAIVGADSAGLFYGRQTLLQLVTAEGVPCVEVVDNPRFGYRGIHLDVSRHFFDKEQVYKILDEMARYKLNRFHFHLTDNGGWRIQIDKYPKLTQLGAFRAEIDWLKWWDFGDRKYVPEGTPGAYGGYYTKAQIREIVAYAAARHIEVIPEIEFPAHSDEVFIGYPELCCSGKAYTSGEFCVGNPKSITFMFDVLAEIIELFPSQFIHIGGDEARKVAWKTCPKCQHMAKALGGLEEVQCYMIEQAEKFLADNNRTMIGWDEILRNNLRSTSTSISYRGQKGGIEAANRGYDAVMSPGEILYFDWYQADPHTQPRAMGGFSPIKKMYSFNPIPDTPEKAAANESMVKGEYVHRDSVDFIRPDARGHIIGVQGCMWTEFVNTKEHLEYMIFPRMLAISELAWTNQDLRDWSDFRRRLNGHIPLLRSRGLNAFTLSNDVEITSHITSEGKRARVMLDTEKYPAQVHYTLDGSEPTSQSDIYRKPMDVKAGATIRAAIFEGSKLAGKISELYIDARHNVDNYYTYLETPEVYASTPR